MVIHENSYINNYLKQLCCRICKVCVSLSVFVSLIFKMRNIEVKKLQNACSVGFMGYLIFLLLKKNLGDFGLMGVR